MFRICKQTLREGKSQAVDYLLLLVAGAILGTLTKVNDETFGSLGYTYTVIAVCKFQNSRLYLILIFSSNNEPVFFFLGLINLIINYY